MGRGGMARIGVGRKPKSAATILLHGSKDRLGRGAVGPTPHVEPPKDLPGEQLAIWQELAPFALEARTLAKSTARAFRDVCETIVLKRAIVAQLERDGLTYQKVSVDGAGVEHMELKAHPLLTQLRGVMQRTEVGLTRFGLAPMGKPLAIAQTEEKDPFAEFDVDAEPH